MNTSNLNKTVPVLLIIFNRYDSALQVINAIRAIKPAKLYIAADGPRENKPTEKIDCEETRKVVLEAIDWDCEVNTNFRDNNLGCGFGPAAAITWFFEHEEQGIILEDDCVPGESFFSFCRELLDHYKDDSRIMHISGFNIQQGQKRGKGSYYFSRYAEGWGWATWRRAWQLFDFNMEHYPDFLSQQGLDFIFPDAGVKKRWIKNFDFVLNETPTSIWDYRWMYSIWKENGLCITPNVSLVQNIGFDEKGTHTINGTDSPFAKIKSGKLTRIDHPELMVPDQDADALTTALRYHPPLLTRAKLKIRYLAKIKLGL